jgi:hypothetical protein
VPLRLYEIASHTVELPLYRIASSAVCSLVLPSSVLYADRHAHGEGRSALLDHLPYCALAWGGGEEECGGNLRACTVWYGGRRGGPGVCAGTYAPTQHMTVPERHPPSASLPLCLSVSAE